MIYSIAETAKANNLKPYDYFEYLLEEIPKHMEDTDRSFLEEMCIRDSYYAYQKKASILVYFVCSTLKL